MYDAKKTALKGAEIFVFGGIGALIAYLSGLPATPTIIFATAGLKMAENYIKNRTN
jgi:hypothetical protein